MHLANFRGVPVFAIFGPTNPKITGPIFDTPKSIAEVSSKNFTSVTELDLKEMSEKLESFSQNRNSNMIQKDLFELAYH